MAIDSKGRLYSSGCEGTIKYFENPTESSEGKELLRCEDEIESLCCDEEILYSGDNTGLVTMWVDKKIKFKFNLVEEVKSLAVEKDAIYSIRFMDLVVTSVSDCMILYLRC